MRVLFICKSNAERSQMGEVLFNYHPKKSKKHKAISAGYRVEEENRVGAPAGRIVTELLLGMGHNAINRAKSRQLTEKMANDADIIVVVLSREEIKMLPEYIKKSPKTRFWTEAGRRTPKWVFSSWPPRTYKYHITTLDRINTKVNALVKELD